MLLEAYLQCTPKHYKLLLLLLLLLLLGTLQPVPNESEKGD